MSSLQSFLEEHAIRFTAPDSPEFEDLKTGFTGSFDERDPSIIVQPCDKAQVAKIVRQCHEQKLSISVRSGGHDLYGRFIAKGAVCIDLRFLKTAIVADNKKTATFDGGCTIIDVLEVLDRDQLQAPFGNCGTVGFTSWSTFGGIGPLINSYGFGSDQIIGMTIVNPQGIIIRADDEMLKVFRGAGAVFGVIVDVTIKVYSMNQVRPFYLIEEIKRLTETVQLQVANIAYESSDMASTMDTFFNNYNTMMAEHQPPQALHITPTVISLPGIGLTQLATFIWNGPPSEEMYIWFDRVAKLANPMLAPNQNVRELVNSMSAIEFIKAATSQLPPMIFGRCQAATISHFSLAAIGCLVKAITEQPEGSNIAINIHILRSDSPSCSKPDFESVLPYRNPRIILEFLTFALDEITGEKTSQWALEVQNRFQELDSYMPKIYLPLSAPDIADPKIIYGQDYDVIKEVKEKHDPDNLFAHSVPRFY